MTMVPIEGAVPASLCPVCGERYATPWRGTCHPCAVERYAAVVEFVQAAEAVRYLKRIGVEIPTSGLYHVAPNVAHPLTHAIARMNAADAECVRLGLWKAERKTRKPPWHYGDERGKF